MGSDTTWRHKVLEGFLLVDTRPFSYYLLVENARIVYLLSSTNKWELSAQAMGTVRIYLPFAIRWTPLMCWAFEHLPILIEVF